MVNMNNIYEEKTIFRRMPARFRYCLLLTTFFFICSFFISIRVSIISSEIKHHRSEFYDSRNEKFAIKTEGCTIPAMKPLDDSIKKFVHYPKIKPCNNANYSLLERNRTHIYLTKNKDTILYYNVTDPSKFTCCYSAFYRPIEVDDINSRRIDNRIEYKDCIFFDNKIEVTDEFVRVKCYHNNVEVYDQFYAFAVVKKFMRYDKIKEIPKTKPAYNVLVMGIDNLSRLNFHRTMPKTYTYLKDNGAVELMGYNKIGHNSFPNIVAILQGHHESELKKICQPMPYANYDDCPFIWHWYKEAGYYTAFGEDTSALGTFNYFAGGFRKMPTDYYLHPYLVEAEGKGGEIKDGNVLICMKEHYFYKILLDYVENLAMTLEESKYFGFFWECSMSHDYLNYPMKMDDSYLQFFKQLESYKYLDNTVIFLISDHGIRWGSIRSTKQGRLEERLPFVYVLTPKSFRTKYNLAFNNLRLNSIRLTTPFDLHETLMDLIDLENITNEKIETRSRQAYNDNRGISWFLPISGNRTCKSAHIADHWCTCHSGEHISINSVIAVSAAANLIQQLNAMLEKYPQCAQLELDEMVEALKIVPETPREGESDWLDYLVVVKTKPGGGAFEATLRYDNKVWTLTGTASRLNLYGDQSRCVEDKLLKSYCYCK